MCLLEDRRIHEVINILFLFLDNEKLVQSAPIKVAEHSFQVLMPNSPLLLNYLCFDASFWRVQVNHRSIYSRILARGVCCCHGNGVSLKTRLIK